MILLVFMMTGGQVLFKVAANSMEMPQRFSLVEFVKVLFHPPLFFAIFLYGAASIFWVYILRDTDLSKAYPFVAITLFLVPLCGVLFLKEAFSWPLLLGGGVILVGVSIIAFHA